MTIDLQQFVRTNKKAVIWICFFGLLFLVREVAVTVMDIA